jgi:hypothetical protein
MLRTFGLGASAVTAAVVAGVALVPTAIVAATAIEYGLIAALIT